MLPSVSLTPSRELSESQALLSRSSNRELVNCLLSRATSSFKTVTGQNATDTRH